MSNPIRDEFRTGLARGDLLVQKCNDCGKLNMYPRHACPHCQSLSLGWHKSTGRGVLHSFTVLRAGAPEGFESDLPYALGVNIGQRLGTGERIGPIQHGPGPGGTTRQDADPLDPRRRQRPAQGSSTTLPLVSRASRAR